jgi:hypothetical protein
MVHIVVGHGEVGSAICEVLGDPMWVSKTDGTWNGQPVDVAHICIPYNDEKEFVKVVKFWKKHSDLVIVHSSVPVGTCDRLGVVHSPIRGVHPNLVRGIKTFVKYFGGTNAKSASLIFENRGITVRVFKEAKTSEALKLLDTTQYGELIKLEKKIYKWCKKNSISFDSVYTEANQDYNEGYLKLGRPEVVRPWLKHVEGPIGGHCVLPNAKLLKWKL